MRRLETILALMAVSASLLAQGSYVFRTETADVHTWTADVHNLQYPAYLGDVRATGMGQVQTAGPDYGSGMLANPAFLAHAQTRGDLFFQAGLPPRTWDAAWFMEDHIDEFTEGTTLNRIRDAADIFFSRTATVQQRWDALLNIQDGLDFAVDMIEEVSGPPDAPQKHGFTILPGISGQIGHWGFSVYGCGQAAFMVRQSSTFDALSAVDFPENPQTLGQVVRPMLQVLGILGTGILQDNRTLSQEIFPVAFYLSTLDVTGAVGYGRTLYKNIDAGITLKLVNRRFSLNRIPISQYDEIIDNAFSDLSRDITGFTADAGIRARLPWGTHAGVSAMNILPLSTLDDDIQMDFVQHVTAYDLQNGARQVDANGDTLMVRTKRPVVVTLPFELGLPFILNAGLHHQFTPRWSAGVDWLDILENDSRYASTAGRIRLGTQYTYPLISNKLALTARLGLSDEHLCGGLGMLIYDRVSLDGAFAREPALDTNAYYAQMRIRI